MIRQDSFSGQKEAKEPAPSQQRQGPILDEKNGR